VESFWALDVEVKGLGCATWNFFVGWKVGGFLIAEMRLCWSGIEEVEVDDGSKGKCPFSLARKWKGRKGREAMRSGDCRTLLKHSTLFCPFLLEDEEEEKEEEE
jgi:hypothetical protein